jgi:hypothetical protein
MHNLLFQFTGLSNGAQAATGLSGREGRYTPHNAAESKRLLQCFATCFILYLQLTLRHTFSITRQDWSGLASHGSQSPQGAVRSNTSIHQKRSQQNDFSTYKQSHYSGAEVGGTKLI